MLKLTIGLNSRDATWIIVNWYQFFVVLLTEDSIHHIIGAARLNCQMQGISIWDGRIVIILHFVDDFTLMTWLEMDKVEVLFNCLDHLQFPGEKKNSSILIGIGVKPKLLGKKWGNIKMRDCSLLKKFPLEKESPPNIRGYGFYIHMLSSYTSI